MKENFTLEGKTTMTSKSKNQKSTTPAVVAKKTKNVSEQVTKAVSPKSPSKAGAAALPKIYNTNPLVKGISELIKKHFGAEATQDFKDDLDTMIQRNVPKTINLVKAANAPKRPKSGFLLWKSQESVKEQVADMKMTVASQQLGKMWRDLSEEEKAPFEAEAEKLKKKYEKELKKYEAPSKEDLLANAPDTLKREPKVKYADKPTRPETGFNRFKKEHFKEDARNALKAKITKKLKYKGDLTTEQKKTVNDKMREEIKESWTLFQKENEKKVKKWKKEFDEKNAEYKEAMAEFYENHPEAKPKPRVRAAAKTPSVKGASSPSGKKRGRPAKVKEVEEEVEEEESDNEAEEEENAKSEASEAAEESDVEEEPASPKSKTSKSSVKPAATPAVVEDSSDEEEEEPIPKKASKSPAKTAAKPAPAANDDSSDDEAENTPVKENAKKTGTATPAPKGKSVTVERPMNASDLLGGDDESDDD